MEKEEAKNKQYNFLDTNMIKVKKSTKGNCSQKVVRLSDKPEKERLESIAIFSDVIKVRKQHWTGRLTVNKGSFTENLKFIGAEEWINQ